MTIKEAAKNLGEMIKEDAVVTAYNEAQNAYANSAELSQLMTEYNVQQTALGAEYEKAEGKDDAVIASIQTRMNELYTAITEHEIYKEFLSAQNAMNGLIEMVNREITEAIFGKPEENCTHDCSTCHGCH